jgi:microcystin-dependent protein
MARRFLTAIKLLTGSTPPTGTAGDTFFNTGTNTFQVHDGSTWITPSGDPGPAGDGVLPGVIVPYAGASAPTGYLLCDGTAVSRTTYADLFAITGTTYGIGDNSTTFNLPNLKGRIPVGLDSTQAEFDTRGETGGVKSVTLTTDNLPTHSHTIAHDHTITHNHTVTVDSIAATSATGVQSANHNHGTNSDGAHNHTARRVSGNNPTGTNVNFHTEGNTGTAGFVINSGSSGHNHSLGNQSPANHTHTYTHGHTGSAGASSAANTGASSAANSGDAGSGLKFDVLNPYIVLNYIIKF